MQQKNQTKVGQIRAALLRGERLTVLTALRNYGTTELRHVISDLKKEGLDIKSEWVKHSEPIHKIYYI